MSKRVDLTTLGELRKGEPCAHYSRQVLNALGYNNLPPLDTTVAAFDGFYDPEKVVSLGDIVHVIGSMRAAETVGHFQTTEPNTKFFTGIAVRALDRAREFLPENLHPYASSLEEWCLGLADLTDAREVISACDAATAEVRAKNPFYPPARAAIDALVSAYHYAATGHARSLSYALWYVAETMYRQDRNRVGSRGAHNRELEQQRADILSMSPLYALAEAVK